MAIAASALLKGAVRRRMAGYEPLEVRGHKVRLTGLVRDAQLAEFKDKLPQTAHVADGIAFVAKVRSSSFLGFCTERG